METATTHAAAPCELLSGAAFARELGVSRKTFDRALALGQIPPGLPFGRRKRWPRALLVTWALSLPTGGGVADAQEVLAR